MQQQQILQGAVPMMAQGQHMMQMQNQMMQYGMQPGMLMGANGVVFPMMQDQGMYSALSKRERDIEAQSEPTGGGGQPVEKRFRAQPRASMPMSHETPLLHKKPRGRPPNNRVWCGNTGTWIVDLKNPPPRKGIRQPRGRPPLNKVWNSLAGGWQEAPVIKEGLAPPKTAAVGSVHHPSTLPDQDDDDKVEFRAENTNASADIAIKSGSSVAPPVSVSAPAPDTAPRDGAPAGSGMPTAVAAAIAAAQQQVAAATAADARYLGYDDDRISPEKARGDAAAGGATTIRELTPSSGRDDDGNAAADRHGTSEQMQPPPPRDTRAPDPSRPSGVAELRGDDDTAAGQMPQTQQVAEGASAAAAMAAMAYRPGASSDRSAGTISPPPGGGGPDHELAEDDHHAAGHLGVLNANGQIMNGNSHMMSRPRGRAPRGKAWSEAAGEWLDDGSLGHQPTSGVTRPRGRAPRGKSWDRVGGIWINEQVPANQYGLGGHGGQPGESAAAARMQHHPQSGGGMPQYAIGAGAMQIMQQQGSGATQGANGQPIQMSPQMMQLLQQQMLQQMQQQRLQQQQQQPQQPQPPTTMMQPVSGNQQPMMPRGQPGGMMRTPGQHVGQGQPMMAPSGMPQGAYGGQHGPIGQAQIGQAPYGMTPPYGMGLQQGAYGMPPPGQPPMSQQQHQAMQMQGNPGQAPQPPTAA